MAYGKHRILHVRPAIKRWSGRMLQKIHMFSRSSCMIIILYVWFMYSYFTWPFQKSFRKSQVSVSIGIHWVTECCTIGSWGRFRDKSSHQMLLCHWNDDSNMLKTSKWHQTGHLKKCVLLQVCHCVIPTTYAVKRAPSCQSCSSHGTRNLRQIFWVDGTQGWTTVKNTTNCVAILEKDNERKNRKSMKSKKHQQSWTSHIYFDPFLSMPVMRCFFHSRRKKPKPWDSHLFTKELLMLRFFWADWAIKCAVCKELLQLNLGRFSGKSYYWHSFNCWWTLPAMFHGYVAKSLEIK